MRLFTSKILLFPQKATFRRTSISRPEINVTSANGAENRPFLFASLFGTIECSKQTTISCLQKSNFTNIELLIWR